MQIREANRGQEFYSACQTGPSASRHDAGDEDPIDGCKIGTKNPILYAK
jgi:hypothetical protein